MKEISYQKFLDDYEFERLRIKIHSEKGELIDIVIQYESFLNNKWYPIVRYDCSHGFFHRDIMKTNGERKTGNNNFKFEGRAQLCGTGYKRQVGVLQRTLFKKIEEMTKKEKINRNIGLTFDFLRQVVGNPKTIDTIPTGSILEFVEKDFSTVEKAKGKYLKVSSHFSKP